MPLIGPPERARPHNSDGSLQQLAPAPLSEPGFTLLFRSEDFGPPAMAHALLGDDWWSWQPGGSLEPGALIGFASCCNLRLTPRVHPRDHGALVRADALELAVEPFGFRGVVGVEGGGEST